MDSENSGLRVIRTARTEEDINNAARNGYFPLVKEVSPSPDIRSKFAVYQNQETGEISVAGDFRVRARDSWKQVIDFTFYYPYSFPSPFAAYLIPPDIEVGEVVILEDLIEDLIGNSWGQGDIYRLKACEAEWNGSEFVIRNGARKTRRFVG